MPRFDYDDLLAFTTEVLAAAGAPRDDAAFMAGYLLKADLHGYPAHGTGHLPIDVNRFKSGLIRFEERPEVVQEGKITAVIDGHHYIGQVTAHMAMELAVKKAQASGAGIVAVRHCGHVGRLADYMEEAADAGMIGFACVSTAGASIVVPYGGREPFTGTNPMAFGIPGKNGEHILLDFSIAVMSTGQMRERMAKGLPIPEDALLDQEGNPVRDPGGGRGFRYRPFGGYKGFGLQVVTEALGAVLTGNGLGSGWPRGSGAVNGVVFQVIAVEEFQPLEQFLDGVAEMVEFIKSRELQPGFEEILLPGERSRKAAERQRREGIEIEESLWAEVVRVAGELGVEKVP